MEGVRQKSQYDRDDIFCGYYTLSNQSFHIESNIERFREEFECLYPCGQSGRTWNINDTYFVWMERENDNREEVYSIYQNDNILYQTLDPLELIPFLEWHLNNSALANLDNYLQIHAGAITKNSKGIILPACANGGKTTLILGLLMRGFKYLSDEVALVDPKTCRISPFPKNLCLKEGSFKLFDPSRLGTQYHVRPSKGALFFINPNQIAPDVTGCPCEAAFLIFPYFDTSKSVQLKKIRKPEALLNMTKLLLNIPYFQEEWLDVLVGLTRGAECYSISVNSLPDTVELISHLVEER
jgi:hypothetical protein